MNLLTVTPFIFPVDGTSEEGLTAAGKELALWCIADYARSLASSTYS